LTLFELGLLISKKGWTVVGLGLSLENQDSIWIAKYDSPLICGGLVLCSDDTSGATAPLSHVCSWCELHYILEIFAKIIFMIMLASNPKTMKFENPDPDLETW